MALLLLEALAAARVPALAADLGSERARTAARALLHAAGLTPEQGASLREPLAAPCARA
jgi:hypothetical protein